ncbi:hypothetical protein pb186bvf_007669 [Paramecium bursaria]
MFNIFNYFIYNDIAKLQKFQTNILYLLEIQLTIKSMLDFYNIKYSFLQQIRFYKALKNNFFSQNYSSLIKIYQINAKNDKNYKGAKEQEQKPRQAASLQGNSRINNFQNYSDLKTIQIKRNK